MTDTLHHLKPASAAPDQDVVAVLKMSLEMAERGELRSVCLVGTLTGHKVHTNYSSGDLLELIGQVGFLHHTLCAAMHYAADPE